MTNLELIRLETSESGTIGVLRIDKRVQCFTLEPPKKGNERNKSCIQTGQYFYKTYSSEKYGKMCIQLHSVFNRDYISIHPGNTVDDTKGCILPGLKIGHFSNGRRAVLNSVDALASLIVSCNNTGILSITEMF